MESGLFVVTGASSGIGQAIAQELAKSGSTVLACGRDAEKLKQTKTLPNIHTFVGDLTHPETAKEIGKQVEFLKTPLKGLVNNAGAYKPGSFLETSDENWMEQFNTNLLSAVRLTRQLFPYLKKANPSSVLNISSTLGVRPVPGTSSYSAMKAAMVNWTECLALEWAPFQIRVNCLCPGLVDTPIHSFFGLPDDHPNRKSAHAMQPLKRMGKSSEIAAAAEFLLSSKSAWTTGSVLHVDGGIHL